MLTRRLLIINLSIINHIIIGESIMKRRIDHESNKYYYGRIISLVVVSMNNIIMGAGRLQARARALAAGGHAGARGRGRNNDHIISVTTITVMIAITNWL